MKKYLVGISCLGPGFNSIRTFYNVLSEPFPQLRGASSPGFENFLVGYASYDERAMIKNALQLGLSDRLARTMKQASQTTLFAIHALLDSLERSPSLLQAIRKYERETLVCIGTSMGSLGLHYNRSIELYWAQRRWNRFWSEAKYCKERAAYEQLDTSGRESFLSSISGVLDPRTCADDYADRVAEVWDDFWARRSEGLREFNEELAAVVGSLDLRNVQDSLSLVRQRRKRIQTLINRWGAPLPPWLVDSADIIWNLDNIPAAQVTMLLNIKSQTIAPVTACAGFSANLEIALSRIDEGSIKIAVVGATEADPSTLGLSAFASANLISPDGQMSNPFQRMTGTQLSGGSCIWIICTEEIVREFGLVPYRIRIAGASVGSFGEHIITPSPAAQEEFFAEALARHDISSENLILVDLHATATPGDCLELSSVASRLGSRTLISAKKSIWGHGLSVSSGWELSALVLGVEGGLFFGLGEGAKIELPDAFKTVKVINRPTKIDRPGFVAKLSMGAGGITAVVLLEINDEAAKFSSANSC